MQATEGHVTIEYSPSDPFPNPDPEFWLTGVATVPDETITALMEGTTSSALLPGIYPGLYQYVPQDCHFSTIDPKHADKTLKGNTLRSTRTSELYPSKHLQRQATVTSS